MAQWGWTPADTDETNSCDFENFWKAKPVTDALGLNAKPKSSGGDNECFCIEHGNELAKDKDGKRVSLMRQTYMVGEKEYMVSWSVVEWGRKACGRVLTVGIENWGVVSGCGES